MGNADRVRANTVEEISRQIDREIEIHVREYSQRTESEITRRINELIMSGTWSGCSRLMPPHLRSPDWCSA
jgi:hypothetical protein